MSGNNEEIILLQQKLDNHIKECDMRHELLETQFHQFIESQKTNTESVNELIQSTKDIIEAWEAGTGAVKVFAVLGRFAKWLGSFTVLVGLVAWLIEHGKS